MIKTEISLSEIKETFKEIAKTPSKIFDLIGFDVRKQVSTYLSNLMKEELTIFLGRKPYERKKNGQTNDRNGYSPQRFTIKHIGEVQVSLHRDMEGEYKTQVIPLSKRYESDIKEDISIMFLSGMSTRSLSMFSERLLGRKISHAEVSHANKELTEAVEAWRNRDLSRERMKYTFVDGVHFSMRVGKSVEVVPVLVVIGAKEDGTREVLGFQSGDIELASNWREFFKDLKKRGLQTEGVELGVMDGLPGLEKVFKEEFPRAKVQRCQVHLARNVLAKVPRKLKKRVADDLQLIFYASSKENSYLLYEKFKEKWSPIIPSAVKTLSNSIDSALTFFSFPENEWISLRTTNIIERLHKEFKRRTKSMEILGGEHSCYRLLAYICLKMEVHWKSIPVGKSPKTLPIFDIIEKKESEAIKALNGKEVKRIKEKN